MENNILNWVKDIFTIIISVSFLEILMPESNMKKYIKFIFSLIVMTVILEPVIRFIVSLRT